MYIKNCWYVVAWSKDITDQPFSRKVLGESIVIYRAANDRIGALENRCPHRHLPLSMGRIDGDFIQCGYHGLSFDTSGRCVAVPSQDTIPPKACVKSYPAQEQYGWVWVWMGDPAAADIALIPDFSKLTDAGFAAVGKTNYVRSNYRLVTDNLMDLSHVGFVHTSTIGNAGMGEKGELKVTKSDSGVRVLRTVPDIAPPPAYIASGELPAGKNIDRWQIIDFLAPCFVMIHAGGAEAGSGALEGRYEQGLNFWVINAMTPETEESTHYFWASIRCHDIDNPVVDKLLFSQVAEAFEEDRVILEAQQQVLSERGDSWDVSLKADAGCFQTRHVLNKLLKVEQQQD